MLFFNNSFVFNNDLKPLTFHTIIFNTIFFYLINILFYKKIEIIIDCLLFITNYHLMIMSLSANNFFCYLTKLFIEELGDFNNVITSRSLYFFQNIQKEKLILNKSIIYGMQEVLINEIKTLIKLLDIPNDSLNKDIILESENIYNTFICTLMLNLYYKINETLINCETITFENFINSVCEKFIQCLNTEFTTFLLSYTNSSNFINYNTIYIKHIKQTAEIHFEHIDIPVNDLYEMKQYYLLKKNIMNEENIKFMSFYLITIIDFTKYEFVKAIKKISI